MANSFKVAPVLDGAIPHLCARERNGPLPNPAVVDAKTRIDRPFPPR
ncbi:MAG TPA: hypothetical protein VME40_15895 [Caulobacteraceae bacterium]|nr:hypothetical protein [Caulobacteraceae bacterium]